MYECELLIYVRQLRLWFYSKFLLKSHAYKLTTFSDINIFQMIKMRLVISRRMEGIKHKEFGDYPLFVLCFAFFWVDG